MQLIFDRGRSTEKQLPIDTISERVMEKRLNATLNIALDDIDKLPDIDRFYTEPTFESAEVVAGEKRVQLNSIYNHIGALNVVFSELNAQYTLTVILEHTEEASD